MSITGAIFKMCDSLTNFTGEHKPVCEIWVAGRVYDALSKECFDRFNADHSDEEAKWHNGLITLQWRAGTIIVRRKDV